ncbi:hypothetical protein ACWGMA_12820 [Streptomyces asiaticus]
MTINQFVCTGEFSAVDALLEQVARTVERAQGLLVEFTDIDYIEIDL